MILHNQRYNNSKLKRLFSVIALVMFGLTAHSEIITDGSMGPALSLQGPNYSITEQLGTRSGNNLFHSFQEFNIANGESALFSGSNQINNVISRVTGGNLSTINGLLQSSMENADFYFINPAGILIGETAQIDVPASFFLSTAGQINFSDGSEFLSDDLNASSLSIAAPVSFGFSKGSSANISIDGVVLTLNPSTSLSLTAGTIDIVESELLVENGNIALQSTGNVVQEIDVPLQVNNQIDSNFATKGSINISQSFLDVGGNGGGIIDIHSGKLSLINSALLNANIGDFPAAGYSAIKATSLNMNQGWIINDNGGNNNSAPINLHIENDLNLNSNSIISSDSYADGNASELSISVRNLTVDSSLILSNSQQGNGNGNLVTVQVNDDITLLNGSTIGSSTYSNGNGGKVLIESNNLTINAGQTEQFTGIASQAGTGSQGNAGQIQLDINNHIDIQPGGKISTDSFANGNGGDIYVKAGNLSINRLNNIITGVLSQAKPTSSGDAGNITIEIEDTVNIYNGGEISTSTFSTGDAGNITLKATNLNINGVESEFFTGVFSNAEQESTGHAGNLDIHVQNTLNINYAEISSDALRNSLGNAGQLNINAQNIKLINGAYIGSNTYAAGNAGEINISAENLNITGNGIDYTTGIYSDASELSDGNAGTINLEITNDLTMQQGLISTNALLNSSGNAGQININVGGILDLSNNSVVNSSTTSTGDAGVVNINAEQVNLLNGGEISSNTYSEGDAGSVNINALNLFVSDKEIALGTGIFSIAAQSSTGHAGNINIIVPGLLKVTNVGGISSDTYAAGNAGNITIEAGSIYLNTSGELYRTGISSNAETGSTGNAGTISIVSHNDIEIYKGARISSSTFSEGNAGNITVKSNNMLLDGNDSVFSSGIFTDAQQNSLGTAGTINIDINQQLTLLSNSKIGSSTYSYGNAGNVKVSAENILIDSQNINLTPGISTETHLEATGNAGNIEIDVGNNLILRQDGSISSFSNTPGDAGNINIVAKNIDIDAKDSQYFNIASAAFQNSSGQVGNINLTAENIYLNNEAEISIASLGSSSLSSQDQPHYISITSDELILENASFITALSHSSAPAGTIEIKNKGNIQLHGLSSITTLALNSDGGPIVVEAGLAYIEDSLISTSVLDELGDGGDITINSPVLLMSSGFIQANTAAVGASGGDIGIQTEQLIIPSNEQFISNIKERLLFSPYSQVNVIQAAAPDGVSGQVDISVPTLDLSASVLNIDTRYQELTKVGKNPCKIAPGSQPSSLTWSSQGGLPTPLSENITLPLGRRLSIEPSPSKQNGKLYPGYNKQFFSYIDPIITIQPEC